MANRIFGICPALVAMACGSGPPQANNAPATSTVGSENDNVPLQTQAISALATHAAEPEILPLTLAPGFRPDPIVLSGTAGGSVDAHSIGGGSCPGHVAQEPSHYIKTSASSQFVRVIAIGPRDLVLMVELSDGTFVCNDDTEGLNPVVEAQMPAGIHRVWVGTFGNAVGASYQVGFSSQPGIMPSAIAATP